MVSLSAVTCPYCHSTSYFDSSLECGHCTACGKIIYSEGASKIQGAVVGSPAYAKQYTVVLDYSFRGMEFNRTIIVNISGPVSRQVAVNVHEPVSVTLPEGEYQFIAQVHVDAGVNSTDITGSKMVNLHSDTTIYLETSGLFSRRLTIR